MKRILLLFVAASFLLFSSGCEDSLTVSFDADFPVDFNIDIQDGKTDGYYFSDSGTFNIEDHPDVIKNIDKLKDLEIISIECDLTGIPEGESINTLTVFIPEAGFTATLENIAGDQNLTLPFDSDMFTSLANYILDVKEVTIFVEGESSYAPMQLDLTVTINSKITAGL